MSTEKEKKRRNARRALIIAAAVIFLFAAAFFLYTGRYYHADETALAALETDETVSVTQTDYGWFFDGPAQSDALIFYPGAKVEETAYAPLLHRLAGEGMDVCLVKMPFRLAIFGKDKAGSLMTRYDYDHWYIGGHSLGGAMAANYAADHQEKLTGVVLLAAYPTEQLDDSLEAATIYGSEDGVLNRKNLEKGGAYLPAGSRKYVIEGGNHAQFGNYGPQKGDGEPAISAEEQQEQTVSLIMQRP